MEHKSQSLPRKPRKRSGKKGGVFAGKRSRRSSMQAGFKPAQGKYYMPSKLYSSSTKLARTGRKTLGSYKNEKFQSSFTMQQAKSHSVIFPKQRRFRSKKLNFDVAYPGIK